MFKSTDRGDYWTRLGGDLTTGADRNKLQIFGKVPDKNTLSRHDGVEEYPTITTLSESPVKANVLVGGNGRRQSASYARRGKDLEECRFACAGSA